MEARPPEPDLLAKAFSEFIQFKREESRRTEGSSLEETQARYLITTVEHLRKINEGLPDFGLSSEDLRAGLFLLRRSSGERDETEMRIRFANLLFEELKRRRTAPMDEGEPVRDDVSFVAELGTFIRILSRHGDSLQARNLAEKYWKTDLVHGEQSPWGSVLNGMLKEGFEEQLEKTLEIMQNFGLPFDAKIHQQIVMYHAQTNLDMDLTKRWYERPISGKKRPTRHTDAAVLRLCVQKGELEWGKDIFKKMMERNPDDRMSWDIILLWAAAKGKGVDEIGRMIDVLVERNKKKRDEYPEIDTINSLMEYANMRDDPYTAERYISLGQKYGLQPNTQTYLLQLDYRIKVRDLSGAMAIYTRLREEGSAEDEDVPQINNLIVALCTNQSKNYNTIMTLVEDLSERKAHFKSETVGALSRLHLQRRETDDLLDLLNTYAFHYGLAQRLSIRDVLLTYIIDPNSPMANVWTVYNILRQVFTETDVSTRTQIMQAFFARSRADMATHVFSHMRQSQIPTLRPTIDTYCVCLTGIGRASDLESLETVHNMLNLDSNIEPDTKMRNALMLAYTGCNEPDRAKQLWDDIVESREGPSYSSIIIALQACEKAPFGERTAREIWQRLTRGEVEVTREVYAAFVGALAGHGLFGECVKMLEKAEQEGMGGVDALM